LSWRRTTDKLAINWQNFAQVGLQLKFAFRIWLLEIDSENWPRDLYYLTFVKPKLFTIMHSINLFKRGATNTVTTSHFMHIYVHSKTCSHKWASNSKLREDESAVIGIISF